MPLTLERSTTTPQLYLSRSTPAPQAGSRWVTASAALAVLALLGVLALPLVTGRMDVYWDLGSFHLPLREAYARCLKAGEPFDWLPSIHNGVFITGEGELGAYHPLHLLLYRWLPLDKAFALEAYLHFPFCILGMFVLLRRTAGPAGALFAGLVYVFSTNSISHGFHVNYGGVLSHLPWLLWLERKLLFGDTPTRMWAAAGTALLTGSQLLLGHPQALSFSLLAECLYAICLMVGRPHPWGGPAIWLLAKLLGAAVGGVQILATLTFLASSNRSSFDPFYASLVPAHFIQLLVPSVLVGYAPGWGDESMYAGAAPLLLSVWALTWLLWGQRRSGAAPDPEASDRIRLAWFAVVLAMVASWLSTGKYGGLYALQTHLPVLGQLRAPARYVNLLDFALAVFSGLALGQLVTARRSNSQPRWMQFGFPWAIAVAAVAAAFLFRLAYPTAGPAGRFLSAGACFYLAACLLGRTIQGGRLAAACLVLLCGWDLYHFSLCQPYWGLSLWWDTATLAEYRDAAPLPPDGDASARVLHNAVDGTHTLLLGSRLVNGYRGGIEPHKYLDYCRPEALRLSGARWYRELELGPTQPIAGLEPVGGGWYRVPDPLPRVRLVSRARYSSEPCHDVATMDLRAEALTTHPVDLDPKKAGTASMTAERPGRLQIAVAAPGKQLLVVAESFDPGWRVAIDGQAGSVERVNADFLGCVIGPGKHTVEFTFAPYCLGLGRRLSTLAAGLALLLGIAGLLWSRHRILAYPATLLTHQVRADLPVDQS